MSFDGPGGVETIEREEMVPYSLAITGDSANGRAPKDPLVILTERQHQISATIATPRVTVPAEREALYVHRMFRYFYQTADNLAMPPFQIIEDLPELRRGRN